MTQHQDGLLSSRLPPSPAVLVLATVGVFLAAVAAAYVLFFPWAPVTLYGDDLANFKGYLDGDFGRSLAESLSMTQVQKYRPLFALALRFVFSITGSSVHQFLWVNLTLHGLNAGLLFLLARRLSGGISLVGVAAALGMAVSRFTLYQATQVTGLLEALAFFWFLVSLSSFTLSLSRGTGWIGWGWATVIGAVAALYTHERYLMFVLWLIGAWGLRALVDRRSLRASVALVGVLLLAVGVNIYVKVVLLKVPFLVGTGGTTFDLNIARTLSHVAEAALSIFGYNYGPAYLVGQSASGVFSAARAALIVALWGAVVGAAAWRGRNRLSVEEGAHQAGLDGWGLAVGLLALAGLMLVPPLATIRLEQRWLVQPFSLVLLVFAWGVGHIDQGMRGLRSSVATAAFFALQVSVDITGVRHFGNLFFVSAAHFAGEVDRLMAEAGPEQPMAYLTSVAQCSWTLQGRFFFEQRGRGTTHACFGSPADLDAADLPSSTRVFRHVDQTGPLVEATDEWRALRARPTQPVTQPQ